MKPVAVLASYVLCLAAVAISTGTAAAKPAYVPALLNLRSAPGITNEIVAKIPAGSLVDAGDCADNWCAVTWQDKTGFSIRTGLDLTGRVPPHRGASIRRSYRGYVPVDGPVFYDEPPVYVGPPPPAYYYPYRYRRYWGRHHYWGPRWHFGMGW